MTILVYTAYAIIGSGIGSALILCLTMIRSPHVTDSALSDKHGYTYATESRGPN